MRRARPEIILTALATSAETTHCVTQILIDEDEAAVLGIAISRQSIFRLAHALDVSLSELSWRANAPSFKRESDGVMRFEVRLQASPRPLPLRHR